MKDFLSYTVEDFVTDESYLRYYFKEDAADIRFWTEWIGLHPEKLDVIISANNYIDAFSARLPEPEFQKEQQRFANTLSDLIAEENNIPYPSANAAPGEVNTLIRRKPGRKVLLTMILLAGLAGATIYIALQKNKPLSSSGNPSNMTLVEKYVPKGQQARISLPDGSEVELNADSKITYPSKFTGPVREIQLSGEAFFRVRPDSLHPFLVTSANLAVTVLGTSFNISCYPGKDQTKVALVTGKVRLDRVGNPANTTTANTTTAGKSTLILTPSEMGVFDSRTMSLGITRYDLDEETGWRRGMIVFRNADFKEIADRFDKVFNIRLINLSHKNRFKFNGTFSNPSPEEIVKSICLSKQLSYEINGNVITIH